MPPKKKTKRKKCTSTAVRQSPRKCTSVTTCTSKRTEKELKNLGTSWTEVSTADTRRLRTPQKHCRPSNSNQTTPEKQTKRRKSTDPNTSTCKNTKANKNKSKSFDLKSKEQKNNHCSVIDDPTTPNRKPKISASPKCPSTPTKSRGKFMHDEKTEKKISKNALANKASYQSAPKATSHPEITTPKKPLKTNGTSTQKKSGTLNPTPTVKNMVAKINVTPKKKCQSRSQDMSFNSNAATPSKGNTPKRTCCLNTPKTKLSAVTACKTISTKNRNLKKFRKSSTGINLKLKRLSSQNLGQKKKEKLKHKKSPSVVDHKKKQRERIKLLFVRKRSPEGVVTKVYDQLNRKKLRSEISESELWEGFPVDIRMPRLKPISPLISSVKKESESPSTSKMQDILKEESQSSKDSITPEITNKMCLNKLSPKKKSPKHRSPTPESLSQPSPNQQSPKQQSPKQSPKQEILGTESTITDTDLVQNVKMESENKHVDEDVFEKFSQESDVAYFEINDNFNVKEEKDGSETDSADETANENALEDITAATSRRQLFPSAQTSRKPQGKKALSRKKKHKHAREDYHPVLKTEKASLSVEVKRSNRLRERARGKGLRGSILDEDQFVYDIPGTGEVDWSDDDDHKEETELRVTRLKAKTPQRYGLQTDRLFKSLSDLAPRTRRTFYGSELLEDHRLAKHACALWSSEQRRGFQQKYGANCDIDSVMRTAWEELKPREKVRYFQRARAALEDRSDKPGQQNVDKITDVMSVEQTYLRKFQHMLAYDRTI